MMVLRREEKDTAKGQREGQRSRIEVAESCASRVGVSNSGVFGGWSLMFTALLIARILHTEG